MSEISLSSPAVVHIQRTGKRRNVTEQTMRDGVRLGERINRNSASMKCVETFLDRVCGKRTMSDLILIADDCTRSNSSVPSADRLARRNRAGLICWFCENWVLISDFLVARYGQPHYLARTTPIVEVPKSEVVEHDRQIGEHPLSLMALLNH
jgi:hypothetical protein